MEQLSAACASIGEDVRLMHATCTTSVPILLARGLGESMRSHVCEEGGCTALQTR